ncbi:MAG: hypothetical protein M3O41_06470 [Pseudomonadota bacterium]|nr:hypothetical protein [Pseudomonadota bacterium]
MHNYTAVRLFIKHGQALAAVVVVGVWICLGWLCVAQAMPWPAVLAGVIASLVAGFFILLFVDLTRIIAEMLLPR